MEVAAALLDIEAFRLVEPGENEELRSCRGDPNIRREFPRSVSRLRALRSSCPCTGAGEFSIL